jgi:hypothetical protein
VPVGFAVEACDADGRAFFHALHPGYLEQAWAGGSVGAGVEGLDGEESVEIDVAIQAEAAAVVADVGSGGVLGEEMPGGVEAGDGDEDAGGVAGIAADGRQSGKWMASDFCGHGFGRFIARWRVLQNVTSDIKSFIESQ